MEAQQFASPPSVGWGSGGPKWKSHRSRLRRTTLVWKRTFPLPSLERLPTGSIVTGEPAGNQLLAPSIRRRACVGVLQAHHTPRRGLQLHRPSAEPHNSPQQSIVAPREFSHQQNSSMVAKQYPWTFPIPAQSPIHCNGSLLALAGTPPIVIILADDIGVAARNLSPQAKILRFYTGWAGTHC